MPTDEHSKKALTARELLVEQFFLPFIVTYLRDMKSESFTILATNEMATALLDMKVNVSSHGHYELNKLSKE
jgi:hypothetical protein